LKTTFQMYNNLIRIKIIFAFCFKQPMIEIIMVGDKNISLNKIRNNNQTIFD